MKNTIFKSIIWILIILKTNIAFSQEKKSPDTFNGFRDIEFYRPITDYFNYNYRKVEENIYEIVLQPSESRFLETRIQKIIIGTYKNQIHEITLILEKDIEHILRRMFRHDSPTTRIKLNRDQEFMNTRPLTFRGRRYTGDSRLSSEDICVFNTYNPAKDLLRTGNETSKIYLNPGPEVINMDWTPRISFIGRNTNMLYGEVEVSRTYFEKTVTYNYKKKNSIISDNPFLSFLAVGYKEKIDSRQVQEHYDSYLSDFGVRHHETPNETHNLYRIPLFKLENSYLVRANFGEVNEQFFLDTGSDYLIISINLYNRLKTRGLVSDLYSTKMMVLADGNKVNLRKVIVKDLQISDLKVSYIEAYVNTTDVSLLGQNFFQRFGKITIDQRNNLLIIEK